MTLDTRKRRIVFLTGTRADFGKIKSLLVALDAHGDFDIKLFYNKNSGEYIAHIFFMLPKGAVGYTLPRLRQRYSG